MIITAFRLIFFLIFQYPIPQESYLVNVSASVLPTKPVESDDDSLNLVSTTEREDDLAKRRKYDE